jgi:hypothetical protein
MWMEARIKIVPSVHCDGVQWEHFMLFSQNQSYFMTGDLPPISLSWRQAAWDSQPVIVFSNWTLAVIVFWVCCLQLLLVLASAVTLGSESHRTRDHILLSQIQDSPDLEGQVPVFVSPGTGWPVYTPRHWVPFSSPPAIRRATVEVFDPASTWDFRY